MSGILWVLLGDHYSGRCSPQYHVSYYLFNFDQRHSPDIFSQVYSVPLIKNIAHS